MPGRYVLTPMEYTGSMGRRWQPRTSTTSYRSHKVEQTRFRIFNLFVTVVTVARRRRNAADQEQGKGMNISTDLKMLDRRGSKDEPN